MQILTPYVNTHEPRNTNLCDNSCHCRALDMVRITIFKYFKYLQSSHPGLRITKILIYSFRSTKTKDNGTTIQLTARNKSARLLRLLKSGIMPSGGVMDGILEKSIGIPVIGSLIVAVVVLGLRSSKSETVTKSANGSVV